MRAPLAYRRLRAAAYQGQRRWRLVAPNTRGVVWALLAVLFMSLMSVHIKYLANQLDSFEVAWFRASMGLVLVLPFLWRAGGIAALRTRRFPTHAMRGLIAGASILSGFYAVAHLPLATATALGFCRPLFMVPLAIVMLHEIVRRRRWTATIVGFLGVLVVVQPTEGVPPAAWVGIFSSFSTALAMIVTKQLTTTEQPRTMIFYNGLFATLITSGPAFYVWQWPSWEQLLLLASMSAVGALGNSCMIRSLQDGEATVVGPIEYVRIITAAGFGFLFFAEIPTLWTAAGGAIIVASTGYITWREARLGRQRPPPGDPPS
jgi:drug/metabolite transporter (DMT)-like permease